MNIEELAQEANKKRAKYKVLDDMRVPEDSIERVTWRLERDQALVESMDADKTLSEAIIAERVKLAGTIT